MQTHVPFVQMSSHNGEGDVPDYEDVEIEVPLLRFFRGTSRFFFTIRQCSENNDVDAEEHGETGPEDPPPKRQKGPKKAVKRTRGNLMTASRRAAQFVEDFEVHGSQMVCIFCKAAVEFKEISFAKRHIASERHMAMKKKSPKMVKQPGPAHEEENAYLCNHGCKYIPSGTILLPLSTIEWSWVHNVCA